MSGDAIIWRCEVPMPRDEVKAMARRAILLIPLDPGEGEGLQAALAELERHVERGGDERALTAFRALSEAFARAKVIGPRRLSA